MAEALEARRVATAAATGVSGGPAAANQDCDSGGSKDCDSGGSNSVTAAVAEATAVAAQDKDAEFGAHKPPAEMWQAREPIGCSWWPGRTNANLG